MGDKTLDFAIVCDSGCDLCDSRLESLGVTPVLLDTEVPGGAGAGFEAALRAAYRELAAAGVREVVSVHTAAALSGAAEVAERVAAEVAAEVGSAGAADDAGGEDAAGVPFAVTVLDSGLVSAAMGMVVERVALLRASGASAQDAVSGARDFSRRVRLLAIPAAGAPLAKRRMRRERRGLLGRASALVRMHVSGERGLYLVSRGELTVLARSTDLIDLTSRLAHAVSAVASAEGALAYVKVKAGDARAFRAMEKPLVTNEFEARCLDTVPAGAASLAALGAGAVAVALAPAAAFGEALEPPLSPSDAPADGRPAVLGHSDEPEVLIDSVFPKEFIESLKRH